MWGSNTILAQVVPIFEAIGNRKGVELKLMTHGAAFVFGVFAEDDPPKPVSPLQPSSVGRSLIHGGARARTRSH